MPLPLIYSKRKLVPSHLWEIPCHHATMPPLTFHLFKLSYVLSGWPPTKSHFSIEATARSPCRLGNAQVTMRNLIPPPKRQQETRDMLNNIMTRYLDRDICMELRLHGYRYGWGETGTKWAWAWNEQDAAMHGHAWPCKSGKWWVQRIGEQRGSWIEMWA